MCFSDVKIFELPNWRVCSSLWVRNYVITLAITPPGALVGMSLTIVYAVLVRPITLAFWRLYGTLSRLLAFLSKCMIYMFRDVPNIRFAFASVSNIGRNSVFVFGFGRIVSSERIRIVSLYMYTAASDVYGRLHSVSASCSRSDRMSMGDE